MRKILFKKPRKIILKMTSFRSGLEPLPEPVPLASSPLPSLPLPPAPSPPPPPSPLIPSVEQCALALPVEPSTKRRRTQIAHTQITPAALRAEGVLDVGCAIGTSVLYVRTQVKPLVLSTRMQNLMARWFSTETSQRQG